MSGQRYLLDTNVVIGVMKGSEPARNLLNENSAGPDICAISQITRIELLSYQSLSAEEEAEIGTFLSTLAVILLDERIERETIAIRRKLRLKLPDALIAATAKANGLTLLTLDHKLASAMSHNG